MKKTDLMRAIEKLDAEIAKHQQEITSLEASKEILETVSREKSLRKAKKAPAVTKRAPRTPRATRSAAAETGETATSADDLLG